MTERVDWVDIAKGICIVFVVMMHTVEGFAASGLDAGWLAHVVDFARPFRMPDFFLVAGLFLALTIDRPLATFIDRKVMHFVYFYVLWLAIQTGFKGGFALLQGEPISAVLGTFAYAFVQPFGTLWFIYLLPVMFVLARVLRGVHPGVVLAATGMLEVLPVETGSILIDEFCGRTVYFMAGWLLAPRIFAVARWARENAVLATSALATWGLMNGTLVTFDVAHLPLFSIVLGAAGATAIVVVSALLAQAASGLGRLAGAPVEAARTLGRHSIAVYLAFFFPMIVARLVVAKFEPAFDAGWVATGCLVFAVTVPMAGYAIVRRTGWGSFLFHRPDWAKMDRVQGRSTRLVPAE